jgi:hypothetical protein
VRRRGVRRGRREEGSEKEERDRKEENGRER